MSGNDFWQYFLMLDFTVLELDILSLALIPVVFSFS